MKVPRHEISSITREEHLEGLVLFFEDVYLKSLIYSVTQFKKSILQIKPRTQLFNSLGSTKLNKK